MFIREIRELIDPFEPQLGYLIEHELMEYNNEARDLILGQMADEQEVQETYTAIDDYSELDITLQTSDYFDNKEIDVLNAIFMEDNEWTETQLTYIVDNLVCRGRK